MLEVPPLAEFLSDEPVGPWIGECQGTGDCELFYNTTEYESLDFSQVLYDDYVYADYCYNDFDAPFGGGYGVGIAVIDGGFDDLSDAMGYSLPEYGDLLHYDSAPVPGGGNHGTRMAAAVHAVAPLADIHLFQISPPNSIELAAKIDQLTLRPEVDIILFALDSSNNSFHNNKDDGLVADAIIGAYAANQTVVLAAGNHRQGHRMSFHDRSNIGIRSPSPMQIGPDYCTSRNLPYIEEVTPAEMPLLYDDFDAGYDLAYCVQNWHYDGHLPDLGGPIQPDIKISLVWSDFDNPNFIPRCIHITNLNDPWYWETPTLVNNVGVVPGAHTEPDLYDPSCDIIYQYSEFLKCDNLPWMDVELPASFFAGGETNWRLVSFTRPVPPVNSYPRITAPSAECEWKWCDYNFDGVCDLVDMDSDGICDPFDDDGIRMQGDHDCYRAPTNLAHALFDWSDDWGIRLAKEEGHPKWSVGDLASLDMPVVVGAQNAMDLEIDYFLETSTQKTSSESFQYSGNLYDPGKSIDIVAPGLYRLPMTPVENPRAAAGTQKASSRQRS